jgi:hypothetical protein
MTVHYNNGHDRMRPRKFNFELRLAIREIGPHKHFPLYNNNYYYAYVVYHLACLGGGGEGILMYMYIRY